MRTAPINGSTARSVLLQQTLTDDRLLDLAGSLTDEQERRLAHQPLDLELLRVAVPSVDAEGVLRDLLAVLAGQQLRHPGLNIVARAGVLEPGGVDHHQVRGLDLGGHLGELERDRLVLCDRFAEGSPLLGVADRELEGADGDAAGSGCHIDPPYLDAVHHLCEALAGRVAEYLVSTDAMAVEDQLGGVE